jgi:hypothetical protein
MVGEIVQKRGGTIRFERVAGFILMLPRAPQASSR